MTLYIQRTHVVQTLAQAFDWLSFNRPQVTGLHVTLRMLLPLFALVKLLKLNI